MELRGEVGGQVALGQTERIEVGRKMPTHAIGADQHHRADAVLRGTANVGIRGPGGAGLRLRSLGKLFDDGRRRIEPEIKIVKRLHRPVRPLPARSLLDLDRVHLTLVFPREGGGPVPQ